MASRKRRSSYLKYDEYVELKVKPLTVWGYSGKGKFVCRLSVNSAGVELYTGSTGNKRVANLSWEALVAKLEKKR